MDGFVSAVKSVWLSVRGNPVFVAFEGGATGAAIDFIDDALASGHVDFSREGIHKLIIIALTGGITAVRLLYRPSPGSNPNNK